MLGFLTVEAASLPAFGGGLRGGEGSEGVPRRAHVGPQAATATSAGAAAPTAAVRPRGEAGGDARGVLRPNPFGGGGRGRGARGALRERRKIGGRSSGVPPRGPLALSTPPWRGAWRPRAAHAPLRSLVSPPSPRPRPIAPRGASARPRGALFQAKRGAKQRTEAAGAPPPSARLLRDEALQRGCGAWEGVAWPSSPFPSPRPAEHAPAAHGHCLVAAAAAARLRREGLHGQPHGAAVVAPGAHRARWGAHRQ